jgi:hypothetical protein
VIQAEVREEENPRFGSLNGLVTNPRSRESIELLAACPAEDGAPVAGGGGPIAYVEASAPAQGSLGHAEPAAG